MVKQVGLYDPVHLQVFKVIRNALIKALTDVRVVLLRGRFAVVYRAAALWPAAVGNTRPDVFVISVGAGKLVVERMVESEQPRSHINFVVVIGVSTKTVQKQRVLIKRGNVGNDRSR